MAFAPRPHVEFVAVVDVPGEAVLFPGASGPGRMMVLSRSPVNGAVSAVLDVPPGWQRERGANPETFAEYYLLSGDLRVGDELQLLPFHYFRAGRGAAAGPLTSVHGARMLFFTEGDPLAWRSIVEPGPDLTEGLFWKDMNKEPWSNSVYDGPPVMDDGGRLRAKQIYRDPETGCHSRLVMAGKGWRDHRTEHHPVVEEMYTLAGHMEYNFGVLEVDTYFYRPPWVKHGFFQTYPDGTTWFLRTDGELENIYTDSDGTPISWEAGTDREPIVVTDVVRSRRAGPWDGRGQHDPSRYPTRFRD